MSKYSSSPMEQGELEASPDLRHSPRILVDLGEADPNADFLVLSGRSSSREDNPASKVSTPERHEEMEDVLIIQPPQLHSHTRKEKHRRHHKDGKKKTKDAVYSDDEKSSNRKSDRPGDKADSRSSSKQSRREEEREAEEYRRKKSLQERERLERLEMERRRLERERERKYMEQQERAAREEQERRQAVRDEQERKQALRDEQERKQALRDEQERKQALRDEQERRNAAVREKERARLGKSQIEKERQVDRGRRNWREEDAKRHVPDKDRCQNRDQAFGVVPVRRQRSRSRSPVVRLEPSAQDNRERDLSREGSQRSSQRDLRRDGGNREFQKDVSSEDLRRYAERDVTTSSSRWVARRHDKKADASPSDEEIDSHSPAPDSKVSTSSRLKDSRAAERASSHESDRSGRSPSPPQVAEPERRRASSQEVESVKSDAESEDSNNGSSGSSSGSSSSGDTARSNHTSPAPTHHVRSKFDDTVNDERRASVSSRSSHESSSPSSRRSDDDADDCASVSPVPSPVSTTPILPNFYPAYQGCRNVEEFHCLNRIEEGTYGVVYRARDLKTNEIVALKRLKMEKEKEGFPITSLREINTLLKSQHENIVTVREIVVGSNMDKIYIVMDYVEHDLKSLMEIMKDPFSIGEVKTLLRQLLRGVRHLHDNWIIHRDLKTSNLLFSHKGILKIGDFGLAREYGSPLKNYTPIVVTLWYRSPELLLGTKLYSCPIDMWSVGCIFAEFLMKKPLFPGKSEIDELNRIFKELGTPTEKIWPGVSELPAMKKCTFTEYPYNQLRSRFGSLLSDKGFELLNKFLTYNPDRRISATDAVKHEYFDELPKPVDPSMFPTWPPKSEQSRSRSHGNSPKPPSGGKAYAKLLGDDDEFGSGFHLAVPAAGVSSSGAGFALKF